MFAGVSKFREHLGFQESDAVWATCQSLHFALRWRHPVRVLQAYTDCEPPSGDAKAMLDAVVLIYVIVVQKLIGQTLPERRKPARRCSVRSLVGPDAGMNDGCKQFP